MKEITLKIKGMVCRGCEKAVKDSLLRLGGIVKAEPSHVTGEVRIVYEETKINEDLIEKTIKNTGREVIK